MAISAENQQIVDWVFRGKPQLVGADYLKSRGKRYLDIIASFGLTAGSAPIALLATAAVLRDDGWPPLVSFRNGVGGNITEIIKIRSMYDGAHSEEIDKSMGRPLCEIKTEDDPRITRVGRVIRKYSIDEIPQLWRVLGGRYSMVGFHPLGAADCLYVEKRCNEEPYYTFMEMMKAGVKPGVTGLYGICGRALLPMAERIELENKYGQWASFGADLKIIAMTAPALISRRGAC
jgi:lipopolysaccharide/colanic/teichoic acid biosynthesis glycosyltransferase